MRDCLKILSCISPLFLASCVREAYTYDQEQRTIRHLSSICDTVYSIYPFASFKIQNSTAEGDYSEDAGMAADIAEFNGKYLFTHSKVALKKLALLSSEYDSLISEFGKMIKVFHNNKEKEYSMRLGFTHHGLALISGSECRLKDANLWVSLGTKQQNTTNYPPRGALLSHLAIVDLETGRVVFYQHNFIMYYGIFDYHNVLVRQNAFEKLLTMGMKQTLKHIPSRCRSNQ